MRHYPNFTPVITIRRRKQIMDQFNYSQVFLLCFLVFTTFAAAHRIPDDEYWQRRALLARESALNAYNPDPASVVAQFNKNAREAVMKMGSTSNSTRRGLDVKYVGPCMATNPIDQCWRCNPNWAVNRQAYADCARGFGAKALGGKGGPTYVVTDESDDNPANPKPGTLRFAVIQPGPLWIVFARSMNIKLKKELIMTSFKTIDGRGYMVQIMGGAGITIQYVNNVIISNIKMKNIKATSGGLIRDSADHIGTRGKSDGDGIGIYGSHDVWIDHLSMSEGTDGLIDAVMGSTAITISNCHFVRHDKVLLFGGRDKDTVDSNMQITLAYNHFGKHLVQRMPRCRRGFFHLVNNDYTHWEMYAIGGSHNATIISQGNRYTAPPLPNKKQVTHRENDSPEAEWRKWTWTSDHDIFVNGAFFVPSGDPKGAATFAALEKIKPAPGTMVSKMTKFAGAIACKEGVAC